MKINCLKTLSVSAVVLLSTAVINAEPIVPPKAVNKNNCADHLRFIVTGVSHSGLSRAKSQEIIEKARVFSKETGGSYQVTKETAAWPNNYNPMTKGGADSDFVGRNYGDSHDLNDKFFVDGEYNTRKMLSASQIKKNVLAMSQEELDSLPPIRKYDIMNGNFDMRATVEQIRGWGLERKPEPQGWEGWCYPMRLIGATCPVPIKVVSRPIPGSDKVINFKAYDVATLSAVNWNGTENYARIGSVNREARDRNPPNAGAFYVMLQSYRIMKQDHPSLPYAAIFDVEPNAQLWNEALQNFRNTYSEVATLTSAQKAAWDAPRNAKTWVDVQSVVDLTAEAGATHTMKRDKTVQGGGLNTEIYEYRIYMDNQGKVIGGAWLEDSGRSFPDLVGFANGRGTANGARYIDHDQIAQLLRESTDEVEKTIPGER